MARRVSVTDGQWLIVWVVGQMPHAVATRDPWIRGAAPKPRASAAQRLTVADGAGVARDLSGVLFVGNATGRAYSRLRGAWCDATSCSVTCGWLWRWPQERALDVVPFVAFLSQIVSAEEAISQRAGNNPRATP